MALCAIATLCRFFRRRTTNLARNAARFQNRNFVAGMAAARCGLCRMGRRLRNGVTAAWGGGFPLYRPEGPWERRATSMDARGFSAVCFCAVHSRSAMRGPPSRRRDDRARQGAGGGRRLRELPHRRSRQTVCGGKRIDTPFGAIYAPNLTPDRETGIGAWSEQDFTARCASASRRTARSIIRPSPIPISRR